MRPEKMPRSCGRVSETAGFAGLTATAMPWTAITASAAGLVMSPRACRRSASAPEMRVADMATSAVRRRSMLKPAAAEFKVMMTVSRGPDCWPATSITPSALPGEVAMSVLPIKPR